MKHTGREGTAPQDDEVLVLWELIQTAHLAAQAFRSALAPFGLTPVSFGVLSHLADDDDLSKAQLARAVLVTPQSMDVLVESLLAEGYVERQGSPRRGRTTAIRITATGLAHLAAVRPAVAELNDPGRLGLDDPVGLVRQLQDLRRLLAAR